MKVYQAVILGFILLTGVLWGIPQYRVYSMKLAGQAKLAESQASRQVLVSEAQAKMEAAKLLGEAELTKAEYQAKAAKTIDESLTPSYLRYLWINEQGGNGNSTFIYIPSDGLGMPNLDLPITEANRLHSNSTK